MRPGQREASPPMVPRGLGQTARMLYTVGVQAPLRRSERDRAVKEPVGEEERGQLS